MEIIELFEISGICNHATECKNLKTSVVSINTVDFSNVTNHNKFCYSFVSLFIFCFVLVTSNRSRELVTDYLILGAFIERVWLVTRTVL